MGTVFEKVINVIETDEKHIGNIALSGDTKCSQNNVGRPCLTGLQGRQGDLESRPTLV